jgi:hypothetical protein
MSEDRRNGTDLAPHEPEGAAVTQQPGSDERLRPGPAAGAEVAQPEPAIAHGGGPDQPPPAEPGGGLTEEAIFTIEQQCRAWAERSLEHGELLLPPSILRPELSVALAVGKRRRRFWPDVDAYRFDIRTPPADDEDLDIQRLLIECERLSDKANAYVSGLDLRIIHQQLFTHAGEAAALLDRRIDCRMKSPKRAPKDAKSVKYVRSSLRAIERECDESAQRDAQLRYFAGMVVGVGAIVVATYQLGGLNIPGSHRLANASFVAGAVGAVMSVLMRLTSGGLVLRYRVGPWFTRFLGFFRPLIGSVFGILMYFLISSGGALALQAPSGFDKRYYFFAVVAFIAGFSERFAPDMLSITEDSLVTRARRRARARRTTRQPSVTAGG